MKAVFTRTAMCRMNCSAPSALSSWASGGIVSDDALVGKGAVEAVGSGLIGDDVFGVGELESLVSVGMGWVPPVQPAARKAVTAKTASTLVVRRFTRWACGMRCPFPVSIVRVHRPDPPGGSTAGISSMHSPSDRHGLCPQAVIPGGDQPTRLVFDRDAKGISSM